MATELSIMIPSLVDRNALLNTLLSVLRPQITNECELLIDISSGEESIGMKRHRMRHCANGRFLTFIDDDDMIAGDYVIQIISAIKNNPNIDCIGFAGTIETPNGKIYKQRYTIQNRNCMGRKGDVFENFVGHITPIRKEIVLSARFGDMRTQEDALFCSEIMDKCQKEFYIDKIMYRYLTRYNV